MLFSGQESWSGQSFPPPGDLPDPEIKPGSPALQADSLPSEPPGKPIMSECSHINSISTIQLLALPALVQHPQGTALRLASWLLWYTMSRPCSSITRWPPSSPGTPSPSLTGVYCNLTLVLVLVARQEAGGQVLSGKPVSADLLGSSGARMSL